MNNTYHNNMVLMVIAERFVYTIKIHQCQHNKIADLIISIIFIH